LSYTKLLVPLDGSEFAEAAISLAMGVGERTGAAIELAAVHEPTLRPGLIEDVGGLDAATLGVLSPVGHELNEEVWTALEERLRRYLDEAADRVRDRFGGTVTTKLLEGLPVEALQARIQEADIDLVVMTTHGRGGLSRVWLGSVADGLVRRCDRPVLLRRPEGDGVEVRPWPGARRVLVPLDGSELAESILDDVVTFADLTGATCTLVTIVIPPIEPGSPYMAQASDVFDQLLQEAESSAIEYLDGVADRLRTRGVTVETHTVVQVQPHGAILTLAEETDADLIAMATHGRSGLRRMVLGSVGDKVLRGADVPVLLKRPRDDD